MTDPRRHALLIGLLLLPALLGCPRQDAPGPDGAAPFQPERQPDPEAVRPPDVNALPARDPIAAVIVDGRQRITIEVTPEAFEPPLVELRVGTEAELTFIRRSEAACGDPIEIPAYEVESAPLPVHQPITITFTPRDPGVVTFRCGTGLLLGRIVSQWP